MTRRDKDRNAKTRKALALIRRIQPKTWDSLANVGFKLRREGYGTFRTCYRIMGTTLLIKFPVECRYPRQEVAGGPKVWSDREGKNHTRMEVKKIRALSEFPMWRKHLPPIHYYNGRDGVLVTTYYRTRPAKNLEALRNRLIGELTKEFCGAVLGDITDDNVRSSTNGENLVIIDCGY